MGKAVIGVAWYLVLPTEMKAILNQDFRRFADDAVVKISRWYYATTGWNAQCRGYPQTVVDTAWQGRIDKFRDGIRRVWRPPGIKVAHQGGTPTTKKATVKKVATKPAKRRWRMPHNQSKRARMSGRRSRKP